MKRLTTAVLLVLSAIGISTLSISAQNSVKQESTGILFQISGAGLAKPSYLFGTFHIICPTDMLPREKLTPYVDQADQLVMEIDMDDPAEMLSMQKSVIISDGRTLKDVLTPEQFAKVDEMFTSTIGRSVEGLKMLKPALLSVLILTSPKSLGCTPSSYDLSLVKIAAEKKKPIIGLETAASQGQVLESKPLEKQAKDLYEIALKPQKSLDELKKVIEAYKEQDAEKLYKVTSEQEDKSANEFQKRLIDDRNKAWIPKIEALIKERPSFIAVGAGHFGGKNGVLKLLRAKGYQVKAIRL